MILYEEEKSPIEPQEDSIWVLNDSGELVRLEVPDDAGDD